MKFRRETGTKSRGFLAGLAGGVALSEGLKAVFQRERPPIAFQAVETINASFPSGHALLSTVFYLSVAVMLTRAFPRFADDLAWWTEAARQQRARQDPPY